MHAAEARLRSHTANNALQQVLQCHPQLRSLKLCNCTAVTDAALRALPGHSMRQLQLLCCDGVQGWFLQHLPLLELLWLTSCSGINSEAIAMVGPCG